MSYNYSEFKKKKKDNFKPSMPPPDNPVPSGLIKDITRTGSEDFIHEYKNIEGDICFYVKKSKKSKKPVPGVVFEHMFNSIKTGRVKDDPERGNNIIILV